MSTDLSIAIVSWNTRELLRRCLVSACAAASQVIVVDNGSSDGSAELVAREFPSAVLIENRSNPGFAAACNRAIEKSSGRYVMLLNPDAELLPGAAEALMRFADSHPEAAVVGPALLGSDGSLQRSGRRFPTLGRELLHITKLWRLNRRWFEGRFEWGREDFDVPAEVDEVCGACMLVRRDAIDSVGGLDERFFLYYEEVDWCRRMKSAGWRVWYLPEARVMHHHGRSTDQIGLGRYQAAYRSQYLYFLKHHGFLQAAVIRTVSAVVLLLMYIRKRLARR